MRMIWYGNVCVAYVAEPCFVQQTEPGHTAREVPCDLMKTLFLVLHRRVIPSLSSSSLSMTFLHNDIVCQNHINMSYADTTGMNIYNRPDDISC